MDTNIYEVTFKNGDARFYGFGEDCKIGDTVVAGTSHGPLLGRISDILDELPDDYDLDKMCYILCRVPEKGEVATKPRQVPITERLSKIEQKAKMDHLAQIEQMMDEFMEKHKKEVMRLVFANYSEGFNELVKEYDKVKHSLHCLEDEDLPDATIEKHEIKADECNGGCSGASESLG